MTAFANVLVCASEGLKLVTLCLDLAPRYECADTIDYRRYVAQCVPVSCVYYRFTIPEFASVASLLLGLVGGIVSSLNVLVPLAIDRCACVRLTRTRCPCEPPRDDDGTPDVGDDDDSLPPTKVKPTKQDMSAQLKMLLARVAKLEAALIAMQSDKDTAHTQPVASPITLPVTFGLSLSAQLPDRHLTGGSAVALLPARSFRQDFNLPRRMPRSKTSPMRDVLYSPGQQSGSTETSLTPTRPPLPAVLGRDAI